VIWNATIDRRPALIVKCEEAGDVLRCVQFARDNGLLVAVKGGGHHIAGNAICDEGMVIDLSPMRSVNVDPQTSQARVGPGATLADVDAATAPYGLAVPTGINSTTGIAGLTLGGGFGWITRKYGLTVDSLVAADVVTAEGKMLRASSTENADLFWALRGDQRCRRGGPSRARTRMRNLHLPHRRRRNARAGFLDRLPATQRALRYECALPLAGPVSGRAAY
jgi:FAD/FMN-containing dehydrogenase